MGRKKRAWRTWTCHSSGALLGKNTPTRSIIHFIEPRQHIDESYLSMKSHLQSMGHSRAIQTYRTKPHCSLARTYFAKPLP